MPTVSLAVVCRFSPPTAAAAFLFLLLTLAAGPASAQNTDAIGVRAQGMAGAFTAVADDSTGGFWNPAGLAGGPLANGSIEYGKPNRDLDESMTGITAAYPALGITYYRLPISEIRVTTSAGAGAAVRQDQGDLRLFGATIGQSFGEHFTVASTIKILHVTDSDTTGDFDLGVMASFGPARIGATLRNVVEPTFGEGDAAMTFARHARAGFALTSGQRGVIGSATVSVDADLMRVEDPLLGDQRVIAVGGEAWAPKNTIGVRGGFRKNTVGVEETMLSGGFSIAIRAKTFVDVYATTGDNVRHGWGVALRVTF